MGGRRNGWFAKVDNGFGYGKWLQGGSIGFEFARVGDTARKTRGEYRVMKLMK